MLPLTQKSRQQGQALVEFSLILPVLLFITIGIIEFGRAFFSYAQVTNLQRQALRYASTVGSTGQTYVNCDLMRSTIDDGVFFGDTTTTIYYLDYEDWDGGQFTATVPSDGNCEATGEVNPADLANGDLLAIEVNYSLDFMTPLFTQTLSFDLYGQRTIVRTIDLTGVPFCGDLICNGDEQGTDSSNTATYCESDCVPGTGVPPTISTITDDASPTPNTISDNDQLTGTVTLVVNATDPDAGDTADSFDMYVTIGGSNKQLMGWDGTVPGYTHPLITTDYQHGSFLTLDFQAVDTQGNSSAIVRRTIQISNSTDTAPTISVISPPDPATVSGTYLVQIDADDLETLPNALTVEFLVNGSQPTGLQLVYNASNQFYEAAWDTTTGSYPDGNYTITASVNDGVNPVEFTTGFLIAVDNSSPPGANYPNISLVTPDGTSPVNGTVAVQMIADDDATPPGSMNAAVQIDSTGWQTMTYDGSTYFDLVSGWNTSGLSNGTHTLQFRVEDGDGNFTYEPPVFVEVANPLESHVYSLSDAPSNTDPTWATTITIEIVDQGDQPVQDLIVFGTWSNGYAGNAQCTTNASGQCTVSAANIPEGAANVKFTVVQLTKLGVTYDSSSNVVTQITSINPP